MKLTKTEQKRKEMLNFMIETLQGAEKSWDTERYQEEAKDFGHERKKGKILQELRNIKMKELGI
jgi:hypothetical protein